MNIVFSSDDNYARHLAACMASIFENNKDEKKINIYVLNVGLSEENIKKLTETVHSYGREIYFVDFSDIKERFNNSDVPVGGFTIEMYTRLFLAEAIPETEHRAMWIDGDTSVLGSIHDMYYCDMKDNAVAAVVDQPNFGLAVSRKDAGLTDGTYFASGMFVANLDVWRKEQMSKKFVEYFFESKGQLTFPDQSILNHVLHGKVYILPFRYHVITPVFFLSYKKMVSKWGEPFYSKQEFVDGKKHPVIVHYAVFRPWKKWCLHPMKKHYRKYLKMTPYKDVPLENDGFFNTVKHLTPSIINKIKSVFSR